MHITVLLIVCLNAAIHGTCTQIPVASSEEAQDNGSVVNMTGCLGMQGLQSARDYWDKHVELHDQFQFGGWACRIGNKAAPDNGKA